MHSSLELGMFFLEELATSSSFGDKTFSLLISVYSNYLVCAVTACHAPGSRASGMK